MQLDYKFYELPCSAEAFAPVGHVVGYIEVVRIVHHSLTDSFCVHNYVWFNWLFGFGSRFQVQDWLPRLIFKREVPDKIL